MDAVDQVRNIETWYGPVNAIKGVSSTLPQGRIVAVLGANGAGKTTLLKTIAGVVDPFKGASTFDGRRSTGSIPTWWRAAASCWCRRAGRCFRS